VHIVITPKSPRHFWQRLPPFGKTFRATYVAILLFCVAQWISAYSPYLVVKILGETLPDFTKPRQDWFDHDINSKAWIAVPIVLTSILTGFLFQIPAQVLLVRIQASLLPPEEDTIVPFDRSFGGRVEPAVVGGKVYPTIKDAVATLGRDSWKRLYLMFFKIFLFDCLLLVAVFGIMVPQFLLLKKFAPPTGEADKIRFSFDP
jgi:hypothetical protein